jgi:hypothetical protein
MFGGMGCRKGDCGLLGDGCDGQHGEQQRHNGDHNQNLLALHVKTLLEIFLIPGSDHGPSGLTLAGTR